MRRIAVDTRHVTNRRAVHLRTLDDLVAEVQHLVAAAKAGKVRAQGNWSTAQVLWHVGKLVECSFDGFPFRYRRGPQWITRMFRLVSWRWLIALAFRPGFQNPPEAALLEPEPSLSVESAAAYLLAQMLAFGVGNR